jgi:serine phosphatase RsbU (regulator of sigma subunit)
VSVVELQAGARLPFYPGGVTGRLDADGRMYELARLSGAVAAMAHPAPAALIEHIVADLDRFAGGHEPEDDVTLVAVGFD